MQHLDKRSFELETIAEITREISIVQDLNSLINLSVNLIRDRFGYYFAGMYVLDEQGEYAVLRAASGGNAEASLAQELRLDLTQINPLAIALRAGKPSQSDDISRDELLRGIPAQPQAISRILLPIQSKKILLGVLDIQTDHPVVFDEMSIRTIQMFTDQLATLIENIRLTQEAENNLMELNRISRLQSQAAWRKSIDQHTSAFEFDGRKIKPVPRNLPEGFLRRLESGRSVVIDEMADNSAGVRKTLLVPLMILNHLIGVVGLEQEDPAHEWSEEEIAIAEAAANRAALTLENVRLLEESQRRAYKEQAISNASVRIGAALNIENILDITAEEIDRVLGNAEVILQINNRDRQSESRMLSE
jgi:GAF domain-containing protein